MKIWYGTHFVLRDAWDESGKDGFHLVGTSRKGEDKQQGTSPCVTLSPSSPPPPPHPAHRVLPSSAGVCACVAWDCVRVVLSIWEAAGRALIRTLNTHAYEWPL
jgi:hypothetical protein